MKAKPIRRLCEGHGMPQLFARPRTPNDNPFIESAFSTVKRAPEYPGRFLDDHEANAYFARYFNWYDTEHYYSGIDYVTPQQAHGGLRKKNHRRTTCKNVLPTPPGGKSKTKIRLAKNQQQRKFDFRLRSAINHPLKSLIQKRADT